MNAKNEFLEEVKSHVLLCATLTYDRSYGGCEKVFNLKVGYNELQLNQFLKEIDFKYDSGFGSQELFGIIWYADGTWSEREEYDGAECWSYKKCPEIPEELK